MINGKITTDGISPSATKSFKGTGLYFIWINMSSLLIIQVTSLNNTLNLNTHSISKSGDTDVLNKITVTNDDEYIYIKNNLTSTSLRMVRFNSTKQ